MATLMDGKSDGDADGNSDGNSDGNADNTLMKATPTSVDDAGGVFDVNFDGNTYLC